MSLQIASINSGSNGNCYYIANENEAVLVDVGISCRQIEKRMDRIGLSMQKVKAIFITHEHIDHIRGVEGTANKYQLPVYVTDATRRNGKMMFNESLSIHVEADVPVQIGNLTVTAFRKFHDAVDPHSFVVEGNGVKIAVITDIGICCDNVVKHFRESHAAFLEANYDTRMLDEGRYPQFLKDRIRSGHGHISNEQALELFLNHKPEHMSHLLLSHLSRDNNSPQLAYDLFAKHAGKTNVIVASRDKESFVYTVHSNRSEIFKEAQSRPAQLSIFEEHISQSSAR